MTKKEDKNRSKANEDQRVTVIFPHVVDLAIQKQQAKEFKPNKSQFIRDIIVSYLKQNGTI